MSEARYLIGIDLGTSNCAVAYVEPARGAEAPVEDFPVPQLMRPGETAPGRLLPSCIYLPGEHELSGESLHLPWPEPGLGIVGEFARWQGAQVPARLIASAKSWLCHPGADRRAPILPWGSPPEVPKLSPVDASARLLQHMAHAWDAAHPGSPMAHQEIIITVPASFDEAARALTVCAAQQAGFENFTLLEEPQAAFYDFISRHRKNLAGPLEQTRLVLVIDVGGGTSDFTLIQVAIFPDAPALKRIAVGEHLMLGGDNMDAALGRKVEGRMVTGGRRLSASQWVQLAAAARNAKESLLRPTGASEGEPRERYNLSLAAEGSRLLGKTLSSYVTRAEAEETVLDGFFPFCAPEERPHAGARLALQELGLPYVQDTAVTRHLAAFLHTHAAAAFAALREDPKASPLPRPDALLLNGGVFNSPGIAERLVEVVSSWWPDATRIPLLEHDSLDLAVARGAAYYGLVRHGLGLRIGGGAAHALYIGLEKTDEHTPAALCVIPRGQEEGQTVELRDQVFQLAVGKPVRFPLYSTSADRIDRSGDIVPVTEELQPLPQIHTLFKAQTGHTGTVPVHLSATLTELGTLELWCLADQGRDRWRLEFELRGEGGDVAFAVTEPMPPGFAEARFWVEKIYGARKGGPPGQVPVAPKGPPPKDAKQLWSSLERTLGAREVWRLPVLRELWSALFTAAKGRRRSAEHERVFYQLLGYCLRPGFGYPLDEWRCEESFRLFTDRVEFHKETTVWKEFWVCWRRLSGGLNESRQIELWAYLEPYLAARVPPKSKVPKTLVRPKGIYPEGLDEMVRLAAGLEHLDPGEKLKLGQWIAERLATPSAASGPWTWALGRLGARVPIYASVHKALPPEAVSNWAELLLRPELVKLEGALFALTQMTRLTGDRARDVEPPLRARVLEALKAADATPSWQRMITEVVALAAADKARALGDTFPPGLSLA